jgi:hypothetical protein
MFRSRSIALFAFALSALALAAVPLRAAAHGRPPAIHRIAFDPDDPDRIVAQVTFGLIESQDGGESWHWICAAAYGVDATSEDPDLLIASGGFALLATYSGVMRATPDLCAFEPPSDVVSGIYTVDLAPDPRGGAIVWALVSSGVESDRVVRSEDSGATWSTIGDAIEDLLVERIAVAPSDPMRIYVTGAIPESEGQIRRAFVLRSENGGETFTPVELTFAEGERFPHVVAIDPENPERLFVRMRRGTVDPRPERLLLSDDGGRTWGTALEAPMLSAFALSEDGAIAYAGSALGGLYISRARDAVFERIGELSPRCLVVRGEELWVCANPIIDGFAIGRSTNQGTSVDPIVHLPEITEIPTCMHCSDTEVICPAWAPDLRSDYETYFGSGDGGMTGLPRDASIPAECRPDAGPQPDAGMPPPPPDPDCGCRAIGRPSTNLAIPFGIAILVTDRSRTRRR